MTHSVTQPTDNTTTNNTTPSVTMAVGVFNPVPTAIYTIDGISATLGCAPRAARDYIHRLGIPKLWGAGYLGSDIIAATQLLSAGQIAPKPKHVGRQVVHHSDTPKYIVPINYTESANQSEFNVQAPRIKDTSRVQIKKSFDIIPERKKRQ